MLTYPIALSHRPAAWPRPMGQERGTHTLAHAQSNAPQRIACEFWRALGANCSAAVPETGTAAELLRNKRGPGSARHALQPRQDPTPERPCLPGLDSYGNASRVYAMNKAQAFGAALAAARKAAGIDTQAALARATGLSSAEVNRYERGARLPDLERFARLTRAGLDPAPILEALDRVTGPPAAAFINHDPATAQPIAEVVNLEGAEVTLRAMPGQERTLARLTGAPWDDA